MEGATVEQEKRKTKEELQDEFADVIRQVAESEAEISAEPIRQELAALKERVAEIERRLGYES